MAEIRDVSAALVWDKQGRFMICRRPPEKARGLLWEFVGGKREAGESGEEALARECREELDIEVEATDVFMTVDHVYPDIHIRLTLYNARIVSGTPKLLEHVAIAWINPDEIDNYPFCPADETILTEIKNRFIQK